MAKKLVYDYTFTPSTNTIVLDGNVQKKRLLLITNVTDNIILFNFADATKKTTSVTYDNTTRTTTIVLEYDCSEMSSSDSLQVFVEEDAVEFKPTPTYIDPVSKFRISQAQTLIDTDFEYGLQATKWETLEMVNNIPGFYSRSGDTPLTIISVTAISGQRNLTVFSPSHGLTNGTPIDVRGLDQSNLDGSYLITSVPDGDSFVFEGRIESNFTGSISGAYTSITPGKFYASSDVEFSSINTDGGDPAEITVITPYPNGFQEGNEFYIVNSIATTNINFDSTAIDPINTLSFVNTVNPTEVGTRNSPDQLAVNIYDYRSTLGNVYLDTTQVSSTTITATAHGLSNLDAVAWVQVSGVKPTAVTDQSFYHARVVNANQFQISTTTSSALVNVQTGMTGIATILKGYRVVSFASSTDRFALNVAIGASSQQPHMLLSSAASGTGIVGAQSVTKSIGSRLWDGSATGLGTANGASWGSLAFNLQVSTTSVQFGFNGTTAFNGTSNASAAQTGFVPVQVSVNTNTILDSAHGLTSNEIVTYSNGGGTAISGLTNSTSYYVDLIDANRFGLKATTAGARINLTGYGATGTNHTFTAVRTNPTKNTIFVASHGLPNGSQLLYDINGGTAIGGLTDLATYYVIDASTDRFRLSDVVGGSEIDLTSVGVGTQILTIQSEGSFDGVYTIESVNSPTEFTLSNTLEIPKTTRGFDPSTDLDTGTDTFTVNSHRYTTGTPVEYDNGGGSDVGGLTTGSTYYVIRITSSTFKLAATYVDAIAGTEIDITSAGSGTTHRFISANIAGELPGQGTVEIVSGSKVVIGTSTRFINKYKVGDVILIDTGTEIFESTVTAISSNTELTILNDAPTSASGLTYLSLTGFYVKSNAFSIHRPFDGGVEINAGYAPLTQIIRQTRRYFRYQSGKGLNCQVAINFNPGLEIMNLTSSGTTATAQTRFRHGMQIGTSVTIRDAEVASGNNPYNGTFTITGVTGTTFTFELSQEPSVTTASGFPFAVVRNWNGALLKTGMFDDQNGMFWEYNGTDLYCVRRNSTKQIAGTVSVTYRSSLVAGTDTRFAEQLAVGNKIVIRGQSYRVINIPNSTTVYISPPYKGVAAENVVVCKTINLRTPQSEWSVDVCDGTGSNGYVLDVTKIQMAYIDYSWYGAGKVRYGFKDANGEVTYVHEYKHNNLEDEAYMRSGNLPARYECENINVPSFAPSLAHWGTTIQMDGGFDEDNAYLFTATSNFLTFTGTSATVTGTTNNYIYVNPNGSTVTVVNTYSVTANISTGNVTTSSGSPIQNRNTISLTNHGFTTGQIVQYDDAGGTAITGLTDLAFYYIIRIDANRFALALTDAGARAGTRVVLTGQGNNNQRFRFTFRFGVSTTNIPGYGQRIVHRFVTNTSGYALIGNVSFGTPISSTAIDAYGSARIFKVTDAGSGQGTVDFFYSVEPVNLTFPQFPSLATNGFIPSATSAAIAHTVGQATPVPGVIPIVSVRLGPSVDSGLIGPIGSRDIVNRMQLDLDSVGLLTTHDVEIQLILNGQLDNVNWTNVGRPSLSQVVGHLDGDNIEGGTTIFTFRASGNSPDSTGKRTARQESFDISSILSLGNCILGGDGVFPDGPDILTIAVSPLDTSTITVNTPMSISGRISWAESQA